MKRDKKIIPNLWATEHMVPFHNVMEAQKLHTGSLRMKHFALLIDSRVQQDVMTTTLYKILKLL